jgi:phage terminase small subunit
MARRPQQPREGPTPQVRRFVRRYLETKPLNAALAYREVYAASAKTAETNGPRLLRSAQVQVLLAEYEAALERRSLLNIERLEEELANIAFFDPGELLDPETGATLPVQEWPPHARRALAGFEEEALFQSVPTGETGPRGGVKTERVQVGVVRKYRWHNKTEAIGLGMKRRGALVERVEDVTPAAAGGEPTDEEVRAVAALRHEVRSKKGGGDAR